MVTFTNFEELLQQPLRVIPPSSLEKNTLSSLLQWMKVSPQKYIETPSTSYSCANDAHQDPFSIPSDYTWITSKAKNKNFKKHKKIKIP